jgi:LacI family sucrose operon transcriptional repressor
MKEPGHNMGEKRVTFKDIADYTGFSKTTISRYFNNPDYLTPENRQKISTALKELHYKENKVAQILARGETEYIGLIVPHMFMSFYSHLLDQFLHTYDYFDYKFLVFSGGADPVSERKYIKELLSYQIEGLVILSHMIPSEELASYDIPVVAIEREDRAVSSVNTDNYTGGVMATELLIGNQCDQLIYVCTDSRQEVPSYDRYRGFLDTCQKNGIAHDAFFRDSVFSYKMMYEFAEQALNSIFNRYDGKKKGIFCSNDVTANIMLNLLFRKYGCLPDDFRIIGFDDSPTAQESVLPLSSIRQQIDLIVAEAMRILDSQIRARKDDPSCILQPKHSLIEPQLIIRQTTSG